MLNRFRKFLAMKVKKTISPIHLSPIYTYSFTFSPICCLRSQMVIYHNWKYTQQFTQCRNLTVVLFVRSPSVIYQLSVDTRKFTLHWISAAVLSVPKLYVFKLEKEAFTISCRRKDLNWFNVWEVIFWKTIQKFLVNFETFMDHV
jgi:hypothetical protein